MRWILTLIAACGFLHVAAQIRVPSITTEGGYAKGVAAPFAGVSGGRVIVAGGANFAEKPVTEGGRKIFYDEIFALDEDGKQWSRVGSLSKPLAHGAAIQIGDSIIFAGGINADGRHGDVFVVVYENSALKTSSLPSLPVALDQHGAAAINGRIYVVGGQTTDSVSSALYLYDVASSDSSWTKLSNIPFPVLQPVVVAAGENLYVWGGYVPTSADRVGVAYDYGYKYNSTTDSWSQISGVPSATMVGAAAVNFGTGTITCIGGVNKEIFDRALSRRYLISKNDPDIENLKQEDREYMLQPNAWYKFNSNIYIYYISLDVWSVIDTNSDCLAKAGAAVVLKDNSIFIINGECKPGVRSPDVWRVDHHKIKL